MSHEPRETTSLDQKFQEVLAAYLQDAEAGKAPDRKELLARHPELAEELAAYFANRDRFAQAAKPLATDAETIGLPGDRKGNGRRITYFGDYLLLDEIARGGMGIVFKARQVSLNRFVALKMILRGELASPADIQRFRSEAEAAANLDHPNIVPIYEVGEHEGQQYFSMKLVEGGNLAGVKEVPPFPPLTPTPLPPKRVERGFFIAARLVATVARAVHYAHQRGILHRDLKPANILIDDQGNPLVTDFGLAKRTASPGLASPVLASPGRESGVHVTQTGNILGTPSYMAPEQAAGVRDISLAADVWSLGAILFELLTGRPPFRADNPLDTLLQVRNNEPPGPRSLNSTIDRDLETICLKCLQREPTNRYASAEALADDLDRWGRGEPINARPVGNVERTWRWCRRNPLVAGLTTGVAAAILAGLVFSSYFAIQAQRRAEEAVRERARAEAQQAKAFVQKIWAMESARQAEENADLAEAEKKRADQKAAEALENAEKAQAEKLTADRLLYAARMNLTQQAWDNSRLGQVQALLDSYRADRPGLFTFLDLFPRLAVPKGNPAFRGFEWYYWDRQIKADLRTLTGFQAELTCVAYSPDGKRLAASAYDKSVRLFDVMTGKLLRTLRPDNDPVTSVAWHPEGEQLATLSFSTLKIWNAADGKLVETIAKTGPYGFEQGLAFCPDGQMLAWGAGGAIEVQDRKSRKNLLSSALIAIRSVQFSDDGKRLLARGILPRGTTPTYAVVVWDTESWKELLRQEFAGQKIGSAALSRDGSRLAVAMGVHIHEPCDIQIRDIPSGEIRASCRGHHGHIPGLAFSPDGKQLVSGSADETVRLWDASDGKLLRTFKGHTGAIFSVAFHPGGNQVASGSYDQTVKLWDLEAPTEPSIIKPKELAGLYRAEFSPDGRWFLLSGFSPSRDKLKNPIEIWDLETKKPIRSIRSLQPAANAVFSPDGKRLAASGESDTSRVLDVETGQEVCSITGQGAQIYRVVFSPDGQRLASTGHDKTLRIWDSSTGKAIHQLEGHRDYSYGLAWSPDDRFILTGSDDGTARIWDPRDGKLLHDLAGHRGSISAVAISPDGRQIATASWDRSIRLWDPSTGKLVQTLFGHTHAPVCLAYSPDGRRLASGSHDSTVKLWDVVSGQETAFFRDSQTTVLSVAFSPDGYSLLATSGDRAIIWNATPRLASGGR